MAVPPLRIRLLGGFDLVHGDAHLILDSSRVQSLLAFTVLQRARAQPRQRIAFLFWPDTTEKQAQTNLRNVVHQLRRALPSVDDYLDVGPRTISLRLDAPVSADVVDFDFAADQAAEPGGPAAIEVLELAIRLYDGDLLPGCYDEWIEEERLRLRQRYAALLKQLLTAHTETGNHERTIAIAQRLLRHDALDEDAQRRLILAHAARGDRAQALRAYHECAAVLERELGVEPSGQTRAAYEAALGLTETRPSGAASAAGKALVGRAREWTALLDGWRAATTIRPHLILIAGEAGIGKTRLIEELAQWVVRQGYPVARARSYAAEGALAYAPVIEWLRSGALRPAIGRLDPPIRAELARLLPELGAHEGAFDTASSLAEAERRQRIYDAVAHSVHATERPLTLIADDLQWCDRETLELLHYLVRSSEKPLFIVGTARPEEVDDGHPLRDIVTGLAVIERFSGIELGALAAAETATLAEQLTGQPLHALEAAALHRETEGNPLFVIETLRTGWSAAHAHDRTSEGTRGAPLSPRVQAVIEARLRQLSPESRRLAEQAATIGREFTLTLLARVRGGDEKLLLQSLDELWRRRIIRERGGDAYDFSHDRIREVAYLGVSPLRRREHHLRVARALEELHGGAAGEASGQIAWHYDLAGVPDQATAWYVRAADAARRVSALDAVARLLSRALDLLRRLPDSRQRAERELEMRLAQAAALVALKGYAATESAESYRRASALCQELGRPVTAPILRALALASIATYDLEATESFGNQLVAAGDRDGDEVAAVEGCYVLGVANFWRGRLERARAHLEAALTRYRPERRSEHIRLYAQDPKVICLSRLAHTLWHLGFPERAIHTRDECLALAESLGDPFSHAYALWFTLLLAIDAEDWQRVRADVSAMQHVASEHGLGYIAAVVESFVGFRETLDGETIRGVARMHAALSDVRAAGQEAVLRPQTLSLLARAHAAAGNHCEGIDAVKAGLTFSARGARFWLSDLHRLHGRLSIAGDALESDIESAFTEALASAREQGSAWVELRAASDLAHWRMERGTSAQKADSRRLLERARARFTEGHHVPAIVEADRLLTSLL